EAINEQKYTGTRNIIEIQKEITSNFTNLLKHLRNSDLETSIQYFLNPITNENLINSIDKSRLNLVEFEDIKFIQSPESDDPEKIKIGEINLYLGNCKRKDKIDLYY